MEPRATIDFETRSACNLRKCGSWKYSLDPSTEILCLVFRLPHWEEGVTGLWHPAFPHLGIEEGEDWELLYELLEWIADGGLVEAHNAWFERGVWTNILVPRFLFPPVPHHQWRCSAAKAATHALPRGLEDATAALNLDIEKDSVGSDLMKKLTKPRKPKKAEWEVWCNEHGAGRCVACKGKGRVKRVTCTRCLGNGRLDGDESTVPPMPVLWHESREAFERLWDYCRVDVLAEEGLSHSIPDLNESETECYLMDQAVNERGFLLDKEAVDTALELIAQEQRVLNRELVELTKGEVQKATQRDKMLAWLLKNGCYLDNTQAATIDALLGEINAGRIHYIPPVVRALELMRALGRSSTAKYEAMRNWMCHDGRVRGGLLYHGANTGRWSGAGVQPHNFPKGNIKYEQDQETKWSMDRAWEVIKDDDEAIEETYGDGSTLEVLSQALRGAIIPSAGKHLFVADYAAIEARVLLWEADDREGLKVFYTGGDIYCEMASSIYGYPCNKKEHPNERALGKVAVLGLGYQMGWQKFIDTCAKVGIEISDEMAQQVVAAYRTKFWRVKELWNDQEAAAIRATHYKGMPVRCGRVVWEHEDRFLYCTLPSGRRLAYPFAKVTTKQMPWGDIKEALSFKGVNPVTRKWHTQTTYGGMLVENQTQAIARDLMAEAMLRCEQSGIYTPILSVHDELIAEADPQEGDVKEFEHLMAAIPYWAEGCPVDAEGWSGVRYRK